MDDEFIEAITGIVEVNEFFIRAVFEEYIRLQNNINNLIWWSENERTGR
jgi:hypothetical protein